MSCNFTMAIAYQRARSPEQKAERTEQILSAAEAMLAEGQDSSALSLNVLAKRAGMAKSNIYRYFESREALLDELSVHEALRFWKGCLDALREAPDPQRVEVLVRAATRQVHEHAALRRILETDPALALAAVREQFPRIRGQLERLLGPQLDAARLVRDGVVSRSDLADWIARLMISAFLIPAGEPDALARGLNAILQTDAGS